MLAHVTPPVTSLESILPCLGVPPNLCTTPIVVIPTVSLLSPCGVPSRQQHFYTLQTASPWMPALVRSQNIILIATSSHCLALLSATTTGKAESSSADEALLSRRWSSGNVPVVHRTPVKAVQCRLWPSGVAPDRCDPRDPSPSGGGRERSATAMRSKLHGYSGSCCELQCGTGPPHVPGSRCRGCK